MNGSPTNLPGQEPTEAPRPVAAPAPKNETSVSMFVKTFAVVGFIAIVVLAAWMSIQIIRVTPSALSAAVVSVTSIFTGGGEETLELTLPTRVVTSGTSYEIAVIHDNADSDALHVFSYECVDGVSFTDEDGEAIECSQAYRFEGASVTVTASSTKERYADVMITIAGETKDGNAIEDSALLTIVAASETDEDSEETTSGSNTSSGSSSNSGSSNTGGTSYQPGTPTTITRQVEAPRSDPNGVSDLSVRILATGVVNKKNGKEVFVAMSELPDNKRAAVKFVVENLGTKTSDELTFTATLPIEGDENYEYDSKDQAKLQPGDKIEFTLSFDEVVEDEDRATIEIDLDIDGKDSKTSNDHAEKTLRFED